MFFSKPVEVWFSPLSKDHRDKVLATILGPQQHAPLAQTGLPQTYLTQNKRAFHYSISHSREQEIIAISDHLIGVDLEALGRRVSSQAILEHFFCRSEYEAFLKCRTQREKQIYFLSLWTQKEALLKMCGVGISFGLNRFSIHAESKKLKVSGDMPSIAREQAFELHTFEVASQWIISTAFVISKNREAPAVHFFKLEKTLGHSHQLPGVKCIATS